MFLRSQLKLILALIAPYFCFVFQKHGIIFYGPLKRRSFYSRDSLPQGLRRGRHLYRGNCIQENEPCSVALIMLFHIAVASKTALMALNYVLHSFKQESETNTPAQIFVPRSVDMVMTNICLVQAHFVAG